MGRKKQSTKRLFTAAPPQPAVPPHGTAEHVAPLSWSQSGFVSDDDKGLHSLMRRARQEDWEVSKLRLYDLPLHLNKAWMHAAIEKHGSYAEIERIYGYSNQALSRSGYHAGIRRKPRIESAIKAQAAKMSAEGKTPGEVKKALGINKTSARRIASSKLHPSLLGR